MENGLGDKTATDADGIFVNLFGPEALEIDANRRKNRHMKDGEKRVREAFGSRKVESDAAKTEINDASPVYGLVAQYGIGIGADHGDAFSFAWNGVKARLVGSHLKRRRRNLQR